MVYDSMDKPILFNSGVPLDGGFMSMWVVYFDPDDFPGEVVARMWLIGNGVSCPSSCTLRLGVEILDPSNVTGDALKEAQLLTMRRLIQIVKPGATRVDRREQDDRAIVEAWL